MLVASPFKVRAMTLADIPQVVEVERESFPTTWPQTAYRRELANKMARYLVLIDSSDPPADDQHRRSRRSLFGLWRRPEPAGPTPERIIGYVGMWIMVDQTHIVAIAVREKYRRQGLGELLLAQSVQEAIDNNTDSLTLEVRRSNTSAQALYEKYRFIKVGVRNRYYSDNHEDAIIMTTAPIRHESYQEHFRFLKDAYRAKWDREI